MRRFTGGRRRAHFTVVGIALLGVLVFAVSAALASNGAATSLMRINRDTCGLPSDHKVVGKVKLSLKGHILTGTVDLHGALPGTYDVHVYDANNCGDQIAYGGWFKVDASGQGADSFAEDVTGFKSFYVVVDQGGPLTESDIISF
jgi:Cu/Zn superoxide dismutase